MDLQERFATIVAWAIVAASVCYWIVQIDGVRRMLALAYG